ncbi:MAG: carboxypeptidase-like regulatory domain-containing protein [Cyclobacteriaceae bacterium]|nr:carboxypeptidase-like regulatory domain-containing protein [Cyclobacteriaceae bacterium]
MKTLFTTLVLMILLNPGTTCAQGSIFVKGQVCNGLNHMALRDCHIYVDGKVAGTISNEQGEFEIEIPKKYSAKSLNFSHIGFETYSIPIAEVQDNFIDARLVESPILLTEVVILPEDDRIVDHVIASVRNEFSNEEDMLEAFYEVLLRKDKDQQIIRNVLAANYHE